MGRRAEPQAAHELRGKPGKRSLEEGAKAGKLEEMPEPPSYFDEYAKNEWRDLGPELIAAGVLTRLDLPTFAIYCTTFSRWVKAEEGITRHGLVVESTRGTLMVSPHVRVSVMMKADLIKLGGKFGMSPGDRRGVTVAVDMEDDRISIRLKQQEERRDRERQIIRQKREEREQALELGGGGVGG